MYINWLWTRQRLTKGWDKKIIYNTEKIVHSKQQSEPASEKMLNNNTQKLT